jgi:cell fate regulator YaaT (PSP1 superfamily)
VFNIDLSFIADSCVKDNNTQEYELKCNSCYQENIVSSLECKHNGEHNCILPIANSDSRVPEDKRNIMEIAADGLLSSCFVEVAVEQTECLPGDLVVISEDDFHEIAQIKLIGRLVALKRQYFGMIDEKLPILVRKASEDDIQKIGRNKIDEEKAASLFKEITKRSNLEMKLVGTHYQFDRKRLFFYYTADGRIDFRELAKELASVFKTRIELRQIGVRDEAKKVGGVGTCGREFCCSSFLGNFKKITTQLANEQNLVTSMGKLSGPCGKLKCCLSFEFEESN